MVIASLQLLVGVSCQSPKRYVWTDVFSIIYIVQNVGNVKRQAELLQGIRAWDRRRHFLHTVPENVNMARKIIFLRKAKKMLDKQVFSKYNGNQGDGRGA